MTKFEQMEFNELLNTYNILLAHGKYKNQAHLKYSIDKTQAKGAINEEQKRALLNAYGFLDHTPTTTPINTKQAIKLIIGTYKKEYISAFDLMLCFDILSLLNKLTKEEYIRLLKGLKITPQEIDNKERKQLAKELSNML